MNPGDGVLAALERAFNRYLRLDPDALRDMEGFAGRVIALELDGLGSTVYVMPGPGGVRLTQRYTGAPDTWIRTTLLGLVRLRLGNADAALFGGEVEISGDTELGQRFREVLDHVEVDWEEQLSHLTGDVIAHQAGNVARAASGWSRRTVERLALDLSEYLHEESRQLATRDEVDIYMDSVDNVRSATDRLAARVARLLRHLDTAP
ncbi:MAG: ubiquinone biosynthesis accessory factor UbiJ [Gammaproteobacteria bacterium]|nr:SCP2 sterol-binding domain-containing protein [Gammaproteobacteria bacterium]